MSSNYIVVMVAQSWEYTTIYWIVHYTYKGEFDGI